MACPSHQIQASWNEGVFELTISASCIAANLGAVRMPTRYYNIVQAPEATSPTSCGARCVWWSIIDQSRCKVHVFSHTGRMLIQVTRRIFPSFFVKKKKVISYDKIVVEMKLKRKERKTRGKKKRGDRENVQTVLNVRSHHACTCSVAAPEWTQMRKHA